MNYIHDRRLNLELRAMIDRLESFMGETIAECKRNARHIQESIKAANDADTIRKAAQ